MKKQILSLFVAMMLVLTSFANLAFAAADYDGIALFIQADEMLDKLNADASDSPVAFDKALRAAQLQTMSDKNAAFTLAISDEYKALVYDAPTANGISYLQDYFKTMDIEAEGDATYDTMKADFIAIRDAAEYDTTGLSLEESLAKLQGYTSAMAAFFTTYRTQLDNYTGLDNDEIKGYLLVPTQALIQLAFSKIGAGSASDAIYYNYHTGFLGDDDAKKLLAMLCGSELTTELATNAVTDKVKVWVNANFADAKALIEDVFVAEEATAVDNLFVALGTIISSAYAGTPLADNIKMFFGDGSDKGALEIAFDNADADCGLRNIWLNLFLRRYVQLEIGSVPATTVEKTASELAKVRVSDTSSAAFILQNLADYGISTSQNLLTLSSDSFNVVCTDENGVVNSNVVYNAGRFSVVVDDTKGSSYDAYITLYRSSTGNDASTFIESYPVTINNVRRSSGGGSGSAKVNAPYANGDKKNTGGNVEEGTEIVLDTTTLGTQIYYTLDGTKPTKESTLYVDGTKIVLEAGQVLKAVAYRNNYVSDVSQWIGVKKAAADVSEILETGDHIVYMIGYEDGSFRPDNNMTRAEVATMFARLMKEKMVEGQTYPTTFSDVDEAAWYADYIGYMQRYGVINGYEDGTFRPDNTITRAEFVTIASRMIEIADDIDVDFADVSLEHWAYDYIAFASENNWVGGYEDGTFRPDNRITRAEVVTIVNRMLGRSADEAYIEENIDSLTTFEDVTKAHWAYLNIFEATNKHDYTKENDKEIWK